MRYQLPTDVRVQCPTCGTPTDVVAPSEPYNGTVALEPCGCVTTPAVLTASWNPAP
jgi:hypothetical protein